MSPVDAKKKHFLMKVRLVAFFHLKLLSRKVLRSRVREEMVAIFAMPRFSKSDTNNNLILYMYRILAFEF